MNGLKQENLFKERHDSDTAPCSDDGSEETAPVSHRWGGAQVILSEEEVRGVFSQIASDGASVEASKKVAQAIAPQMTTNLAELFVELVQRRIFGAQITYTLSGQRRMDTFYSTKVGIYCLRTEVIH